jgi:hypothetical protein
MSSTIPSPHANSFVIGTGVINAHTLSSGEYYNRLTKSKGGIISSPAAPVRAPGPARAPCSHPQTGPPDSATSPVIVLYSRALCARLCVLALPPSPAGFWICVSPSLVSAYCTRARLSFPAVYVGVVECAPASPYTYSSSTQRFPDERTPIEDTPLSATSTELGLGWGLGLGLDSLSHSSSHTLSFFSPPSFHTLSLCPAFTSVWWSA